MLTPNLPISAMQEWLSWVSGTKSLWDTGALYENIADQALIARAVGVLDWSLVRDSSTCALIRGK
ncbi:hypothetical protein [Pseudovibrio sp. JE062]|uniref:hypothetical protein n=1 Tax=Pseudovibrio sp. JE062 TaxID=439495 RepID=UPI000186C56D|nr:hypothetical protein [Pseudovibrio sp. JE062]EEA94035.1 hypothetical protein PJE062_19 [Pseudovibrio sp. JE062]